MRADLRTKIAPPTPIERKESPGTAPLNQVKDSNDNEAIDFGSLLANSNQDIEATRKAQKQGAGLGAAKSDQEFFEMLRKQTNQRPAPKNTLDKDDFLKLFVAQLQNQNPLQPKEDAEMAAQLAHFNSLEQMVNVNKKLEEMNQGQKLGQSVHLVNYIGKEITVDDGRGFFRGGSSAGLKFSSKAAVEKITVEARDETGQLVATQELRDVKPGTHAMDLQLKDAKGQPLKDGVYQLDIRQDPSAASVAIETTITVKGIDLDGGGQFHTDIGKVGQDQVRAVGVNGFAAADSELPGVGAAVGSGIARALGEAPPPAAVPPQQAPIPGQEAGPANGTAVEKSSSATPLPDKEEPTDQHPAKDGQ